MHFKLLAFRLLIQIGFDFKEKNREGRVIRVGWGSASKQLQIIRTTGAGAKAMGNFQQPSNKGEQMHKQALQLIRDSLADLLDDPEVDIPEGLEGLLKMYVNVADIALQTDPMFWASLDFHHLNTGISKDDMRRSTN
jgi:hypothetical protein